MEQTPEKPIDLAAIIEAARKKAQDALQPRPEPTAAQIAAIVQRLARHGYEPSEAHLPIIADLLRGHGVLISGEAGRGKTFFFSALRFRIVTAEEIISWGIAGLPRFHEQWDGDCLTIDDLGAERESVEWGARDDLIKSVIAHRAEKQNGRTHITTNLTAAMIRARYGDRTLSRILGMCKPHKLSGLDRRWQKAAQ
jgi:hypothetical protein